MLSTMQRKRVSSSRNPQYTIPSIRTTTNNPSSVTIVVSKSIISKYKKMLMLLSIPLLMFIITYFITKITSSSQPVIKHNHIKPNEVIPEVIPIINGQHGSHSHDHAEDYPDHESMSKLTNIRNFMNDREQYKDYDMVILYYSSLFGMPASNSYLKHDIGDHICNITDNISKEILLNQKILLTDHRDLEKYASGFVFHG
eukprot:181005_1